MCREEKKAARGDGCSVGEPVACETGVEWDGRTLAARHRARASPCSVKGHNATDIQLLYYEGTFVMNHSRI